MKALLSAVLLYAAIAMAGCGGGGMGTGPIAPPPADLSVGKMVYLPAKGEATVEFTPSDARIESVGVIYSRFGEKTGGTVKVLERSPGFARLSVSMDPDGNKIPDGYTIEVTFDLVSSDGSKTVHVDKTWRPGDTEFH